jgi:hypothetical protein
MGRDMVAPRMSDEEYNRARDRAAAFEKRVKDRVPLPGSEEALRKLITGLQAGKPDESMMSPDGPIHQELERLQKEVSGFGGIQSITFTGVGPGGPDIYLVKAGKGAWECRIWLSPEGKIDLVNARPMQ